MINSLILNDVHQIDIFYDQTKLHHWAVCLKGNTQECVKNVYGTDNGVVLARCGGPENKLKLLFGMMTILMGTCCNFMQVLYILIRSPF